MWQNGENKLQTVISFLSSARASMKEDDRRNVQPQTDGVVEWTGCSDSEPDTAGGNEAEPLKEEAVAAASSTAKRPRPPSPPLRTDTIPKAVYDLSSMSPNRRPEEEDEEGDE